jgi:hypothetical protein
LRRLALLCVLWAVACPALAQEPTPAQGLESLLREEEFQTELPGHDAAAGRAEARDRDRRRGALASLADALPAAWRKALVWAVLLLGVGSVLWVLVRSATTSGAGSSPVESWSARRREPGSASVPPPETPAAPSPPSWQEAEALAAQGELTAALRVLLTLVLAALGRRRVLPVDVATTGRELLGRARWSDGEERDLERVVTTTERALFAGRPASLEDFDTARAAARRLVEPS